MAAEAAISSAVELLSDLLVQKVKSIRGVEGKVQSLKEELEWMQSFLKKANKKQAEDEGVREWINKIREVAQDAEDTIELFLINVENARNSSLLRRCTSFAKRMYNLDRIGDEIESIRARLDAIDKSRERYGIKDLDEVEESAWRSQVESRRRLSFWKNDEHLVGMEDDVNKLLRESILNEEKKGLSIAVVEGMGGIGKSTLARAIFNHRDVAAGRFDHRGWVVVSSEFAPQETIKQIIFQLQSSEQDKQKVLEEMTKLEESMKDKLYLQEELKQMLHKQLEGKSYFIVLDDVWEKEHLESLITAFPNQKDKTSRLLVTTRNKLTTKLDQYVHKMKVLDSDKSWELLLNKANIGSTSGECPEELGSIGRQILEKCCGLPLAISVVGGLLVGAQTKGAWEQVLKQINSYLGRAESSVSAILELSYQKLSPQLKSCFLCLAFFKEDAIIPARRLVDIWVAQGLIQKEESRAVDEIAIGYINELINRSMVQVEDLTIDDRVETCHLHDLVREVCMRKAKEEIGLEIVKAGEAISSSSVSSYKSRHRVVYGKYLEISSSKQNEQLRSVFLHNINGDGNVYMHSHYRESFYLIKILDLNCCPLTRLPDSFQLLIGLKCLRIHKLRIHNSLNLSKTKRSVELQLPIWLDQLKKLEVLCLENQVVGFPNVTLRMERLRDFHVHYSIHGRAMKIENWKNIESLKEIRLKDWLECSSRLEASCHLRELGIYINEFPRENELNRLRLSLGKMENLVELHLQFSYLIPMEGINFIRALPDCLTKLKLSGRSLKCPAASEFPPNLTHLTLVDLEEDPMEELGKLTKLQYLTLSKGTAPETRTIKVLHDGFPCLKALCLQKMSDLIGIDIEQGGMPRLKHLQIFRCPNLETRNLPKHIFVSPV